MPIMPSSRKKHSSMDDATNYGRGDPERQICLEHFHGFLSVEYSFSITIAVEIDPVEMLRIKSKSGGDDTAKPAAGDSTPLRV